MCIPSISPPVCIYIPLHIYEPTEEDLEKLDQVQELRRKKAFGSVPLSYHTIPH